MMVEKFKNHVEEAIMDAGNALINNANSIAEDVDLKKVYEVYITIRVDRDGTSSVEVSKTYDSMR